MHSTKISKYNNQAVLIEHVDDYRTEAIVHDGRCYEITIGHPNSPNTNCEYVIRLKRIHEEEIKAIEQRSKGPNELEQSVLEALNSGIGNATLSLLIEI